MSNKSGVTPVGRLSYPHLFTPQDPMNEGEEAKFGAAIIFEEGTDLSGLKAMVSAAATDFFGAEKAASLIKAGKLRLPLRDDWEEKGYPENSTFFNARTKQQPGIVSRFMDPETERARVITDERELYPGCDVKFHVTAYGYDVKGNKGVAFGLNHVMKYGDNERLDGRASVGAAFADDLEMPSETDLSSMEGPASPTPDEDVAADGDLSALM